MTGLSQAVAARVNHHLYLWQEALLFLAARGTMMPEEGP